MRVLFLGGNELSLELVDWLKKVGEEVFYTEEKINLDSVNKIKPDFIISYNYKHIIPKDVVKAYYLRIINLHISLLPYNRGAYPNVWSFLEDTPKGVTIHLVDEDVDTGDILLQKEVFMEEDKETLRSSYLKLHKELQELFKQHWEDIKSLKVKPFKQPEGGSTHYRREYSIFEPFIREKGWDTPIRELKERYRAWRLQQLF